MLELRLNTTPPWHTIVGTKGEIQSFIFWLETNPKADGLWVLNKSLVPFSVAFAFFLNKQPIIVYLRNEIHYEDKSIAQKGMNLFNEYREFLKC